MPIQDSQRSIKLFKYFKRLVGNNLVFHFAQVEKLSERPRHNVIIFIQNQAATRQRQFIPSAVVLGLGRIVVDVQRCRGVLLHLDVIFGNELL